MKNLEWKAELRDPNLARLLCKHIRAQPVATIRQTDTYYNVTRGRLKRRESAVVEPGSESPEPTQYIFYERPDEVRPRYSNYTIMTPDEMATRYGSAPIPEWLTVHKTRELFLRGPVRIHIDDVKDLGWHFEFEIVMDEGIDNETAALRGEEIRATFAPALGEPVQVSYADLLATHKSLESDPANDA